MKGQKIISAAFEDLKISAKRHWQYEPSIVGESIFENGLDQTAKKHLDIVHL